MSASDGKDDTDALLHQTHMSHHMTEEEEAYLTHFQFDLPETVHSIAALSLGNEVGLLSLIPIWIVSMLTFVIQFVILVHIWQFSVDTSECGDLDPSFVFLCLVLFVVSTVSDMKESLNIMGWIYYADTLGTCAKWSAFICIIIPRAVITVMLFYTGGVYLLLSDTMDVLILNSIALIFVDDIDSLFMSSVSKLWLLRLSNAAPAKVKLQDGCIMNNIELFTDIYPVLSLVFVFGLSGIIDYISHLQCESFA